MNKKVAWLFLIPAILLSTSVIGKECGKASWYSLPGQKMANGKPMNVHALAAAHKTRRLGSVVTVKNMENGRSVTVKIVDRGPYVKGRIIDLTPVAARILGIIDAGTAKVCIF